MNVASKEHRPPAIPNEFVSLRGSYNTDAAANIRTHTLSKTFHMSLISMSEL